jgi:hypothetical protein
VSSICKNIKERCNDVEGQNLFANMRDSRPLILYSEMKTEWIEEEYTVCCTRNERSGLGSYETGIWKLKDMKKEFEKDKCRLCSDDEDAVHKLLKCSEKGSGGNNFLVENGLLLMTR